MVRSYVAALGCAAVFGGCTASAPRLHQPDRIDAHCGDRVALVTAIESIVSSTSDAPVTVAAGADRRFVKDVEAEGGVVAHWNDQLLYLPVVAKVVGAGGDYVTIGDVAIGKPPLTNDSRRIFLTVKTGTGPRTFALDAYDIQDVCNEGKLKS